MALIGDLIDGVQRKLANRDDVPASAPYWIRDAIRELTTHTRFEELQTFGPVRSLTTNLARYDITFFTNDGDLPSFIGSPQIFVDYPTNSLTTAMKYREPSVVLPISRIYSLCKYWTRVGATVVIGPAPDVPYQVEWVYQKKHKFNIDTKGQTVNLEQTPILMPEDWLEIVEYSAAYKGSVELRLPDYTSMLHSILFGDPSDPGRIGMVKAKLLQHEKDKVTNEGSLVPVVTKY